MWLVPECGVYVDTTITDELICISHVHGHSANKYSSHHLSWEEINHFDVFLSEFLFLSFSFQRFSFSPFSFSTFTFSLFSFLHFFPKFFSFAVFLFAVFHQPLIFYLLLTHIKHLQYFYSDQLSIKYFVFYRQEKNS